jgi:hypothetical protein
LPVDLLPNSTLRCFSSTPRVSAFGLAKSRFEELSKSQMGD